MESRLVLAMVFAFSAATKVFPAGGYASFRKSFAELSGPLGRWTAGHRGDRALPAAVPAAEALLVAGLLAPAGSDLALAAAFVLLLAFSAALAGALRRGSTVSCNCFGAGHAPVGRAQLARNALLMATAGTGLAGSLGDSGARPIGVPALLVGVLAATAPAWIAAFWDDLADLLATPG
ncbi:MauE/DoxX family redox-associated membrane protein [Actinacidiphila yanglinensis]|uniref:MauE/DoxX family redox-associated membrane protein n=1 Tax=Actinacidiphila yanglinensis TaxID=310779 RepID=UPI000CDF0E33|nr:MauE/DoxX family redox-associated membrane protein [Actinacidiphila yanglinensis]